MKNKDIYLYIYILISVVLISCSGKSEEEKSNDSKDQTIEISKEQFEQEKMQIGSLELKLFEDELKASGKVTSPANGITRVSSKIGGIVENIYVNFGDYVRRYQVLLSVSSNELIVLQQNFAETSILLDKLKSDYDRIKGLYEEQISPEKDFTAIESEYNSAKVRYNSLKLQIQQLGLNIEKVEKGEFYTDIPVYSPISGYVTDLSVVLGEYVEPKSQLVELVNVDKLQIELSVYEKDIRSIEKGNKISFTSLGNLGIEMFATIISVGKTVDYETNTVQCIAKPDSVETLINNSYVDAYLKSENREVMALPNDAIIKSEGKYFVFVIDNKSESNYILKLTQVDLGSTYRGYTEILNNDNLGSVIVNGAYNLPLE
jgi:cobalt-zinc-cadmium efflux system membrane fusion protein